MGVTLIVTCAAACPQVRGPAVGDGDERRGLERRQAGPGGL